jgi:MFS family permease
MSSPPPTAGPRDRIAGVNRNVFLLGVVSFLADTAGELIYPLIPIFITVTLGAPASVLGLIEGVAESAASLLRVVSGWLADRLGRSKPLVALGYGLAALAKPLLAIAPAWPFALVARALDRTGKGLRGAPRDALIAAWTPAHEQGRAFGFHRAFDTAGAVVGPLLALLGLWLTQGNLRLLFLFATIPATLAVLAVLPVHERPRVKAAGDGNAAPRAPLLSFSLAGYSGAFKRYLLVTLIFALGNSSDVFLLLRAKQLGFTTITVVLVYALYNVVYAGLALPAGIRSDRIGRRMVLLAGLIIFAAVYLGFALVTNAALVWVLFAVYGAYIAFTEGVGKALISDLVPQERRATAFGVYSALVGVMALLASVIAGLLWDRVGPAAPFLYGSVAALLAAALLWFLLPAKARELNATG